MRTLSALFLAWALVGCQGERELVQMVNQGPAQGSTFSIQYLVPPGVDYRSEIDSILKVVDNEMSLWVESSEISRLNNGDSILLSENFRGVIAESILLSELTEGSFDITIAPLIKAWGFSGGEHKQNVNVDSLMNYIGYERLKANIPGQALSKYALPKGYEIDVNAIAQGYTVDLVANFLLGQGVENFLVEIGGEVICKGTNVNGRKWRIGIEQPQEERIAGQFQTIVQLDTMALATSGNYRKFWVDETGQKVVHTIDPQTGQPVISNLLSASVIAPSGMLADALATACMVEGVVGAKAMIERWPSVEGYFIVSNKFGELEVVKTSGWGSYEPN